MLKKEEKMILQIKTFFIFVVPLIIGLITVYVLKNSLGTQFPYNLMIPKSIALLFFGSVFYSLVKKENYTLTISLLSVSMLISSIWMLIGASTTLGGMIGDNYFSASMVSTFMHTFKNEDFTFTNLSSFYPYYYHYTIAMLGNIFGIPSYEAIKYGALATVYLVPVITYYSWKKIFNERKSLMMTLGTLFVLGIGMYFRKPYETISLVLIIPWWIYYFHIASKNTLHAIVGGTIGGILFGIYYYWFFPIVLSSIYILITEYKKIKLDYKYYLLLISMIVIVASPYLFPYVSDLLFIGSEPYQNRWFTPGQLNFPLQSIHSIQDVLLLIGMIYLIFDREKQVTKYLFILLVSSYLWIIFGHIAIINDTPLLHTKIKIFIKLIEFFGFVLFVEKMMLLLKLDKKKKSIMVFAMIILTTGGFFMKVAKQYNAKDLLAAKNFHVPSTVNDKKFESILEGKTLLSIYHMNPYWYVKSFSEQNSHYAHPSSLTSQRLIFLLLLSKSQNNEFVNWMLLHNKFAKIDYVWLNNDIFTTRHDNFPNLNPYININIKFTKNFFSSLQEVENYNQLYKVPESNYDVDYNQLSKIDKTLFDLFGTNKKVNRSFIDKYLEEKGIYIDLAHSKIAVLPPVSTVQAKWNLYLYDNMLTYVKKPCSKEDIKKRFYMHIVPKDLSELPKGQIFKALDFHFDGLEKKNICIQTKELPDFDIKAIGTGQYSIQNNNKKQVKTDWSSYIEIK